MESLEYASIINYEVVYLFRYIFFWLQVYIEKEIHDENFSVISNVL